MSWLRGSLVVIELSLAIVLLSGAGLFLNTLLKLYHAPLAVGIDHRLTMRVTLNERAYPTPERRAAFLKQVLDGVSALPGVLGVGINAGLHPIWGWDFPVEIPGSPNTDKRPVNFHQVNAGWPENHCKHRGQDEQNRGEENLGTGLLSHFFGSLHPLDSKRFGVDSERLHQAGSKFLGLKDHRCQAADFFKIGALAHLSKCLAGGPPKLDLALDDIQLHGKSRMRCPQLACHSLE